MTPSQPSGHHPQATIRSEAAETVQQPWLAGSPCGSCWTAHRRPAKRRSHTGRNSNWPAGFILGTHSGKVRRAAALLDASAKVSPTRGAGRGRPAIGEANIPASGRPQKKNPTAGFGGAAICHRCQRRRAAWPVVGKTGGPNLENILGRIEDSLLVRGYPSVNPCAFKGTRGARRLIDTNWLCGGGGGERFGPACHRSIFPRQSSISKSVEAGLPMSVI